MRCRTHKPHGCRFRSLNRNLLSAQTLSGSSSRPCDYTRIVPPRLGKISAADNSQPKGCNPTDLQRGIEQAADRRSQCGRVERRSAAGELSGGLVKKPDWTPDARFRWNQASVFCEG